MQALRFDEYGTHDVLQLVAMDPPLPGPGQVQIQAAASGVNFAEVMFRRGQIQVGLPHVPGLEVVGRVTAIADDVIGFAVGDMVAAMTLAGGGQSEVVVADAAFTVALTGTLAGLDEVLAAAVLCNGTTALGAVEMAGRPQSGETVLVTAASGGVGTCLVDVLHGRGVTVVAVTSDPDRLPARTRQRASAVATYGELGQHGPFDVVFDTVGGPARAAVREHLRLGSRHVIMGDAAQQDLNVACDSIWMSFTVLSGYNLGALAYTDAALFRSHMRQALELAAAGTLLPSITTVKPIDVPGVHERLEARVTTGKHVIDWRG